jgi:hypothetical protein
VGLFGGVSKKEYEVLKLLAVYNRYLYIIAKTPIDKRDGLRETDADEILIEVVRPDERRIWDMLTNEIDQELEDLIQYIKSKKEYTEAKEIFTQDVIDDLKKDGVQVDESLVQNVMQNMFKNIEK